VGRPPLAVLDADPDADPDYNRSMQLVFEQIRAGGDRNFGYLLADRDAGKGVLIDPSYSPDAFVQRARDQAITIVYVINTHSHPDHVNGNDQATSLTGAPLVAHEDAPTPAAFRVKDGQEIAVGSLVLRFMHVPGHCADHVVIYEPRHALLITGDLLFVGKVGGTRSDEDARVEWESLQRLVAAVPTHATVWPGHDYGARPSSTMALEEASNPFLRCTDVETFLALKRNWSEVKQRFGLR
jgi:glyoxylase-like metal-dependent hydrolase (beta-lactamase superfamily II)